MTNTINENNMEEIKSCCGGGSENQEGSCCSGEEQSCCGGNNHDDQDVSCCSSEENSCNCGHDHGDHDHPHHDHDHEHEHAHMVTFENEDGTTEEYPVVDEFELEGEVYILVMNEDETVTPLRVAGDDGELVFLTEEEFHTVSEAYEALSESDELQ